MITYKFRLYPNKFAESKLNFYLKQCRVTYNYLIETAGEIRAQGGKPSRFGDTQRQIVLLKETRPWLNEVPYNILQYENYRLHKNISNLSKAKQLGSKVGSLRFASYRDFKSFEMNTGGFKVINKKLIKLCKIGYIPMGVYREIPNEQPKHISVLKELGKWYICLVYDSPLVKNYNSSFEGDWIGLDVGLKNYITDNLGNVIKPPKILFKRLEKLAYLQQRESFLRIHKKKHKHISRKVSKLHWIIKNIRNDFLNKLADDYCKKYKLICVENLDIKEMVLKSSSKKNLKGKKNKSMTRNIHDASWGMFFNKLENNLRASKGLLIRVDPKNTSKECSYCGNIQDMPLRERVYKCANCGVELDRDKNSAINILNRGEKMIPEIKTKALLTVANSGWYSEKREINFSPSLSS